VLDEASENLLTECVKAKRVLTYLGTRYKPERHSADPFRVLISTILSQRTREENTELASQRLFAEYKTAQQIARAPVRRVETLIKPAGFYRVKTRKIKETSSIILTQYGGKVPSTMEDLLSLPGVGQKTANCVLAYGFHVAALPVDTHVHRISNRLGLVSTRTPIETESALRAMVPRESWGELSLLLIHFGRDICLPRIPKCHLCGLNDICDYARSRKNLPASP